LKKPDTQSQNDETSGLKRLGGEASDASNRIPADLGSMATDKINREQATPDPDPVALAGAGWERAGNSATLTRYIGSTRDEKPLEG
jgi:hypothetical protein